MLLLLSLEVVLDGVHDLGPDRSEAAVVPEEEKPSHLFPR
jgi:hypothetical protein